MKAGLRHTFSRFFPAPKYIALPSVGIDISDTSLKYIQFEKKGNALGLLAWGDLPVPEGAIVQGIVKNAAALGKVMAEVRKVTKTDFARLSLPEERAYLFETTIKRGLPPAEIYSALEFRLEENVPLSPRDAEFDYDTLERNEPGEEHVVVTAYGKETIMAYQEACAYAGVIPLSFEVEAQALARAVVRAGDPGTHLIVDFGKIRTGVGVVENGTLMLTSTVDLGGKDLDAALRANYPNIAEDELIRLKNEYGLLATEKEKGVREALINPITNLKNELAARISYWQSHGGKENRPIDTVILCGGIANLAGLPAFFSEALSTPTVQAEVWQNAFSIETFVPPITRRYSYGYATAVGLALGSFTLNEHEKEMRGTHVADKKEKLV